jgi:hypothetical protein
LFAKAAGDKKKAKAKKKKKKKAEETTDPPPPDNACGLYPWLAADVDAAVWQLIDDCEFDADKLQVEAARIVYSRTPEGEMQQWPPAANDARAVCLWDRIAIRVNLLLAQAYEAEADDACELPDVNGEEEEPEEEEEEENGYEPYPPPGPVNLIGWEHHENFPEPGKFHQVTYQGGHNSATTLKHIAQKAIAQIVTLVTGDVGLAGEMMDDENIWRAYRDLIDCSPWNHALYGVKHSQGKFAYDTPHNEQVAMNPVHDEVRNMLAQGESPARTLTGPGSHDGGGRFAYLWLPPLDIDALVNGNVVRVDQEYWSSGDSKIMPPPEVLALGVLNVPSEKLWGCLGEELAFGAEPIV